MGKKDKKDVYEYTQEHLRIALQISPKPLSLDALNNAFGFPKKLYRDLLTLESEGFLLRENNTYRAKSPLSEIVVARIKGREGKGKKGVTSLTILKGGREYPLPFPVTIKNKLLRGLGYEPESGEKIAIRVERHHGVGLRATKLLGGYKKGAKPRLMVEFNAATKSGNNGAAQVRISKHIRTLFDVAGKVPKAPKLKTAYPAQVPDYLNPERPILHLLDHRFNPENGEMIPHIVARKHQVEPEHSTDAIKQAKHAIEEYDFLEDKHRRLLVDEPILIIDPEDAHDHDDGVLLQRVKGGYRTLAVIADVAFYVRPGTLLDQEARDRAFTHYFETGAFHMLPPKLVEHCSLKDGNLKPVIYCERFYDDNGNLTHQEIGKGIIQNQKQISYKLFSEWLETRGLFNKPTSEQAEFTRWCWKHNVDAGDYIGFEDITSILRRYGDDVTLEENVQNQNHPRGRHFVEFMMIESNIGFCQYLHDGKEAFPFRIHAATDNIQAFTQARALLAQEGIRIPETPERVKSRHLSRALRTAEQVYKRRTVEQVIRSLIIGEGKYSLDPYPHLALGLEHYTHATSPIRRYADIMVQRALHRALGSKKDLYHGPDETDQYNARHTIDHLNEMQRIARLMAQDTSRFFALHDLAIWMEKGSRKITMSISKITPHGIEIVWDRHKGLRKWFKPSDLPTGWRIDREQHILTYRTNNAGDMLLPVGSRIHVEISGLRPDDGDWDMAVMRPAPAGNQAKSRLSGEDRLRIPRLQGA